MRKIIAGDTLGPNGSDYIVVVKNDDGTTITELFRESIVDSTLYPSIHDNSAKILFVNKILAERSEESLTPEEIEFINNPKFSGPGA